MSDEDAAAALLLAGELPVAPGQEVLKAGQRPAELLIPLSGRLLRVADPGAADSGELVEIGEPVGLDCLLGDKPLPYSLVAEERSVLAVIPWGELKASIDRTQGLANYLTLAAEYVTVRMLDQTLQELGCAPAFRAALLGALEFRLIEANAWLAQEGEVPDFIFYVTQGTLQAYSKAGKTVLRPLWIAPNHLWQFWDSCLGRKPLGYNLKAVSRVDAFMLTLAHMEGLRLRYSEDFETFKRAAPSAKSVDEAEAEKEELLDQPDDLFPQHPRPALPFRLSYPLVMQNNDMDCGPACLAMISIYHGNALPIQFWRARLSVNQEGTSLFDLASAAEKAGFVAHGLQIPDIEAVDASLFPFLALRRGHYLVIYEADSERVVMGDPAAGVLSMPVAEFKKGFDGYVLMLRPTEQFFQAKAPPSRYAHFWGLFKGHRFDIAVIGVASLTLTLLSMVPAFISQFLIDQVLAKKDLNLLAVGLAIAVLVSGMMSVTGWLQSYYMAFLSARFDFAASSAFMRRLYSLPYGFFVTRQVGDFMHRLSEMQRIRTFLTNDLIQTLLSILNLAVYSVVLFLYSPAVTLAVFLSAPLLVAVSAAFSSRLLLYFNELFTAASEQDSLLADHIKGIATIKVLGAEVASRWRFEEALVRTLHCQYGFRITAATLGGVSSFLGQIIDFGIMGFAAYIAIQGQLTTGQVISVAILAGGVVGPFHALAGMWSEVLEFRAVLDRLNDVFLAEPESTGKSRTLTKHRLRGEIEFRDVWFRYGGDSSEWVLKGMNFRILPGQSVAVVGPSGAGKSTLALLIARLYEPTRGMILLDGIDYRQYDQSWLRKQVGLLLQETSLFYGTIFENIAWGDARPDRNRVEAAAEVADAKDFILEKPSGYDYFITHGGIGVSGGQKQRIGIARMLYTDPAILCMDEATSSVDAASEISISSAINKASRNRTVVSIAHRYNTAKMSEFAMVVQGGQVVEFGTHAELLERGGHYARFFGAQISI